MEVCIAPYVTPSDYDNRQAFGNSGAGSTVPFEGQNQFILDLK